MAGQDVIEEGLWIDGRRGSARSADSVPVLNPATGEILAQVAQGGPEDVDSAVAAARSSWERGDWRRATVAERSRVLLRLAERIRERSGDLAALESRNVGKPISEASGEIEMGAACFQYYAGLIPA